MPFNTPIAFLIFNRPGVTRQVFETIRRVRPTTLLVIGDGPRAGRQDEAAAVAATRAIIDEVDWPCDVATEYSTNNLGCKRRVASGLDWVFDAFDEAIVLEDDCIPDPTFFPFCQEMLSRYRNDERIFSISGDNFQRGRSFASNGYYFSKYFHCWGWASWRRAWKTVDLQISKWPQFTSAGGLHEIADSPREEAYWQRVLDAQHRGEVDSWAYSCLGSSWMKGGLHIHPDVNLVSNIGFAGDATHTTQSSCPLANMTTQPLYQWNKPEFVVRNKAADMRTFDTVYARPNRLRRWKNKVQKQWKRWSASRAA